jgi:hypothetical protein
MRVAPSLVLSLALILAAGLAGFGSLASGHDDLEKAALEKRVKKLELRLDYLLAREKAVTDWVLRNQQRSADLQRGFRVAREQGFTAAAISSTSREALLSTLEAVAVDLGRDLPEVTKEQTSLLEHAEREGE